VVGGAVRDAFLNRPVHDIDFIVEENALEVARRVADELSGAFYPLDPVRNTGRVVLDQPGENRLVLDFAVYQGSNLDDDLRARDFTINAMAMEVHPPYSLLDPLGGLMDLRHKRLRACSATTFTTDPVRILRGVRLASDFGLRILPETLEHMRQDVHRIPQVSAERLRDELFRILDTPRPAASVRALDRLGALAYVLPELSSLKNVVQPPPHILDAWEHTLDILQKLDTVIDVLGPEHDPEAAAGFHMGLMVLRLGRFRDHFYAHLKAALNPNRSHRSLLFMAALYHDAGKPMTKSVDADGRIHFYEHEDVGAKLVSSRARRLHLSNAEVERLHTIVKHHMRPLWLAQTGNPPSDRAIYRFFRDTREAGVDICLLSLADTLATYGPTLPQDTWANHLEVIRSLLEAWWEKPGESVSPPPLLTGHDLIEKLGMKPGPKIGEILEAVREAQVANKVHTRSDALRFAKKLKN
jgi:putative nucleotidyltransferase with HDIG domain